MSKIAVIARISCKPEAAQDVEDRLRSMIDVVAAEEGTEQYVLHRDTSDPTSLWMYELYTDMGAFGAHSGSPQMAEMLGALGDATSEPPLLVVLEPLAAKGVEL